MLRGSFLALLLLASAALGIAGVATRDQPPVESRITDRPVQRPDQGYASSDVCRACHPSQYASWHASYHRTMTQVATPATAIPDFNRQTVSGVHGRPMLLHERGQELWAEFDDPDSPEAPERRPRIERRVAMITGSHNQQVFWYPTGHERLLGQLPGAYLVAEQRWIPRRMAVLHPPSQAPLSESGHWNSTCIACHATNGKPQFDTPVGAQPVTSQSIQTTAAEFGIACEQCHGPSDAHVNANRNLLRRYSLHLRGAGDPSTVQPARLDPKRSSQVCGQCHAVWEFYDSAGERRANSEGLPFRPGDELSASRFVAQPTANASSPTMQALLADDSRFIRDAFWPDGKVRVSGREYNGLIESPCYQQATTPERTLSCFSCHSLHKSSDDPRPLKAWADDQLSWVVPAKGAEPAGASTAAAPASAKPAQQTARDLREDDEACLQCHESMRARLTSHTRHDASSSGSRCYNCHMPYTTYGLLKTIRSHTVSSPSVAESANVGRPNACNLCHLDRTLGWTSKQLTEWYGIDSPPLNDDQEQIAASILWLLEGDAGQRAIVSRAMAWPPAQRASGPGWMAPYLAQLLDDPYDAIRLGAAAALTALPGFSDMRLDATAPPADRRRMQLRVMANWDRVRQGAARPSPELLMTSTGELDVPRVLSHLRRRNNRAMLLRE